MTAGQFLRLSLRFWRNIATSCAIVGEVFMNSVPWNEKNFARESLLNNSWPRSRLSSSQLVSVILRSADLPRLAWSSLQLPLWNFCASSERTVLQKSLFKKRNESSRLYMAFSGYFEVTSENWIALHSSRISTKYEGQWSDCNKNSGQIREHLQFLAHNKCSF